jgi:hypothetical protein
MAMTAPVCPTVPTSHFFGVIFAGMREIMRLKRAESHEGEKWR